AIRRGAVEPSVPVLGMKMMKERRRRDFRALLKTHEQLRPTLWLRDTLAQQRLTPRPASAAAPARPGSPLDI
ncbi:hypothetical protein J6590_007972, partial [Homalodisca vitripennis]